MNDLTVAVKGTKKTNRKMSKSTMMMKFCFDYNLLKTWLAQLTVWYPLFYYDTTKYVQLNSSGEQNYTEKKGENTLLDAGISSLIQHLN